MRQLMAACVLGSKMGLSHVGSADRATNGDDKMGLRFGYVTTDGGMCTR